MGADLLALAAREERRARRGLERLRRVAPERRLMLARNCRGLHTAAAALVVVDEARRQRQRSPETTRSWAEVAVVMAEAARGPCSGDARAAAWAELANAHRILGEWMGAARAFRHAHEALEEWSGDPEVLATVVSLQASLALSRERPLEAVDLLVAVLPDLERSGSVDLLTRLLVKLVIAYSAAGQEDRSMECLYRAWRRLPSDAEPGLRLSLIHETIYLTAQMGRPRTALRMYEGARWSYHRHGTPSQQALGRWIAGRALGELGEHQAGARMLAAARAIFDREGRSLPAAQVILDQALVELQRAPERAVDLLREGLPLLSALELPQSALAALRLAMRAGEAAGLHRAVAALRRRRSSPSQLTL